MATDTHDAPAPGTEEWNQYQGSSPTLPPGAGVSPSVSPQASPAAAPQYPAGKGGTPEGRSPAGSKPLLPPPSYTPAYSNYTTGGAVDDQGGQYAYYGKKDSYQYQQLPARTPYGTTSDHKSQRNSSGPPSREPSQERSYAQVVSGKSHPSGQPPPPRGPPPAGPPPGASPYPPSQYVGYPGQPPPPPGVPPDHRASYPGNYSAYPPPPLGAPPRGPPTQQASYPGNYSAYPPPPPGAPPRGPPIQQFQNDGNFMEIAKKKMEEQKKREAEERQRNDKYGEDPPKKKSRWGPKSEEGPPNHTYSGSQQTRAPPPSPPSGRWGPKSEEGPPNHTYSGSQQTRAPPPSPPSGRWGPKSEEGPPNHTYSGSQQTRAPPPPPSGHSSGKHQSGGGGKDSKAWPPSLNSFVENAFARCVTDEDRFVVQKSLKGLISDSISRNKLWSLDWTRHPLPKLASEMSPSPSPGRYQGSNSHRGAAFNQDPDSYWDRHRKGGRKQEGRGDRDRHDRSRGARRDDHDHHHRERGSDRERDRDRDRSPRGSNYREKGYFEADSPRGGRGRGRGGRGRGRGQGLEGGRGGGRGKGKKGRQLSGSEEFSGHYGPVEPGQIPDPSEASTPFAGAGHYGPETGQYGAGAGFEAPASGKKKNKKRKGQLQVPPGQPPPPETPPPPKVPVNPEELNKRAERANRFAAGSAGDPSGNKSGPIFSGAMALQAQQAQTSLPNAPIFNPPPSNRGGRGRGRGRQNGTQGRGGPGGQHAHAHVRNRTHAFHQFSSEAESGSELDLEALTIKGTCMNLEKRYFRLTSAPDPSTVRPQPVLVEALNRLKTIWKEQSKNYEYICDQLKAVRQDCTVQRIKNEFAVEVYETHGRIALEEGDLNEYNQCQTQLKELYDAGVKGHVMEFLAYRILYYVNMQDNQKNKDGSTEILKIMKALPTGAREDEAVSHALKVRQAMACDDYHIFFKLYEDAPNMAGYIMDMMLDKIRLKALQRMVKAYKPTIQTDFVSRALAFDSTDESFELLNVVGVKFVKQDGSLIDCKNSSVDPGAWQKFKFEKDKGSLL